VIVDLPGTTTASINRKLVDLREGGGTIALGRVLTLVIVTGEHDAEMAIEAANSASHEHPCRVIVVVQGTRRGVNRLDAQIRVGGDAGASEVLVLRLYGELAAHGDSVVQPLLLPDSPVVVWWPGEPPAVPAQDPIGRMGHRRITDAAMAKRPRKELTRLAKVYRAGDSDLAWTRLTIWRGLLAATLDQPPYEKVEHVTVSGASDSPSTDLLAGWLAEALRCPVLRTRTSAGTGMSSVRLERRSGNVDLVRANSPVATLTQPGQPERRIGLQRRSTAECLAEELRRLETDAIYEEALTRGLVALARTRTKTSSEAIAEGEAPSVAEVQKRAVRAEASAGRASRAAKRATPAKKAAKRTSTKKASTKKAGAKKVSAKKVSAKKAGTKSAARTSKAAAR
jgi:glucose-6-phosphate dehydrogenase assembly protein OpcA